MGLEGEYLPSPRDFPREQVELYERSGGLEGNTRDGYPVIILTSVGVRSGQLRKTPLIRVEHEGRYAAVASYGARPENPAWVANLRANPIVDVQDGPTKRGYRAVEPAGEELERWWTRAIEAFPLYGQYRDTAQRTIPLFVLEPAD